MRKDHYAILGVTPASEDVVIRAAYHALMRRYHPDADPSAEAAERSRAINEAYAVLRDPEKRARYDATLVTQDLLFDPAAHPAPTGPRRSRLGPATAIAFALLAVAMITFAVAPPVTELPSLGFGDQGPTANAVQRARSRPVEQAPKQVASLCANSLAAGLIKRELFRRAGQMRGSDGALLGRAAQVSVVRVDPSSDGRRNGASDCSGWVTVDLPPGLVVDGGRTNLNAEVAYGLAGGSSLRLASLSGADRLVRTLATLGPAPREPDEGKRVEPAQIAAVVRKPPEPVAKAAARKASAAKPVQVAQAPTGCARLANRADQMICVSGNLSSLDRQLALLYRQSWDQADEKKRAALLGSRQRFNDRREACGSPNCMTTAYLARLKEISDIMAGRAQR